MFVFSAGRGAPEGEEGRGGGGGGWGWERGGEVERERTVSGSLSNGPVKAQ